MRILHLITSLRTGGAEHLLVDLLPRLRDRGHDVAVLLFDGTPTPFREQLERAGIAVHALADGPGAMHNPCLVFALRRFIKGYDIVHAHNTPCQLLLAAASYGTHCRMVTTEHSTHNRRRGKWQWRLVDRWMYGRYRSVICCSGETETALRQSLGWRQPAEKPRTVTISNGVDTHRFAEAEKADRAALMRCTAAEADGQTLVVMVAAFRPQKYQEILIGAMAQLPDNYRLALVGDGERRAECEETARSLGVEDRVTFTGIRSDIPQLLKAADILALATHHEGLSLSSLEGMASGRPFIGSDVEGVRDTLQGAGLLVANTPEAFAEAIRSLATDRTLYNKVAAACQRRAAEYDIERTVDGYVREYERIGSAFVQSP